MLDYFVVTLTLMALGHPALTLSQRERGFSPFSLWEKGGDGVALGHEGKPYSFHRARSLCESI